MWRPSSVLSPQLHSLMAKNCSEEGPPGLGSWTWMFEGLWEVGAGPAGGAGKYIFALVIDYSSQFVRHSHVLVF